MATETRTRYLHALGFRQAETELGQSDVQPGPGGLPSREKSSKSLSGDGGEVLTGAVGSTAEEYSEKDTDFPHVTWSSADGEWERLNWDTVSDQPASSICGQPQTLAGTVAHLDNATELDTVWARYKTNPSQEDRDQLIVYYAPLVKYVAGRIASGLPQNVDQSDLVSYGMFGLIDAIAKFDIGRGFKFETYAISRIKGAVLDELRSIDWVPRSVRAKAKSVERAMAKLESQLHRAPTDEEIAEELELSSAQLNGIYNQISSLGLVALDEMLSFGAGGGDGVTLGDTLADRRDGPGGVYERVEMRQMLAEAINRMGERSKIVLTLYYYENLTLAEIGQVLGVTESRVCQIHTKAVLQLRSKLTAQEREAS